MSRASVDGCGLEVCDIGFPRVGCEGGLMSKGMDRKKETKRKPLHTKEEKRAMKREKKRLKGLL